MSEGITHNDKWLHDIRAVFCSISFGLNYADHSEEAAIDDATNALSIAVSINYAIIMIIICAEVFMLLMTYDREFL